MLRSLLGEPPRQPEERLDKAYKAMKETIRILRHEIELKHDPTHDYRKLEIWILGLISSLNELEECLFASSLRITSYNVCYTKLLRVFTLNNFEVYLFTSLAHIIVLASLFGVLCYLSVRTWQLSRQSSNKISGKRIDA